jgi:hypothetical protein
MTTQPLAYGLYNPATDKLDSRLFQRYESAVVAAKRLTGRWRTIVAAPLVILGEAES